MDLFIDIVVGISVVAVGIVVVGVAGFALLGETFGRKKYKEALSLEADSL